jgi:hypothetical protein
MKRLILFFSISVFAMTIWGQTNTKQREMSESLWLNMPQHMLTYDDKNSGNDCSFLPALDFQKKLKSSNSYFSLDSVVSDIHKIKFQYDANGNIMEAIYYGYINPWGEVYPCYYLQVINPILTPVRKSEFGYDQRNNLSLSIYYRWEDNNWLPEVKHEYTWDEYNNVKLYSSYYWEKKYTGKWVLDYKSEYFYNNKNELIKKESICSQNIMRTIEYTYDNGNKILEIYYKFKIPEFKFEYEYSDDGIQTGAAHYEWWEKWIGQLKSSTEFDKNGNKILESEFKWDYSLDKWFKHIKQIHTYDENNNLSHSNYYERYTPEGKWIEKFILENTYDENGRILIVVTYIKFEEVWIGGKKEEYTYNSEGHIMNYYQWDRKRRLWFLYSKDVVVNDGYSSHKTTYLWHPESDTWYLSFQMSDIRDEKNNTVTYVHYSWDNFSTELSSCYKTEISYDLNYTYDNLIVPWWWYIEDKDKNIRLGVKCYSCTAVDNWTHVREIIYYISDFSVAVSELQKPEKVIIYPNPVTDNLFLNIPHNYSSNILFELFDLHGRKIMHFQISNNEPLSLENITNGMYIYQLRIDEQLHRGKLVKK